MENIKKKKKIINKFLKNTDNIMFDHFHFFSKNMENTDFIYSRWKDFIERNKPHKLWIKFYLHIPYCISTCNYCMYSSVKMKNNKQIQDYINNIINYLDNFKKIFKDLEFNWLYVGWGTPSILKDKQMKELFEYILNNFYFRTDYYKSIELNPYSTTFEKLEILNSLWFDRISFWVQSFNKKTLQKEKRPYISPKKIKELIDYSKKLYFENINIDFIMWLTDETEEEILNSIKNITYIKPHHVVLYTILKNRKKSPLYQNSEKNFYENINILEEKIKNQPEIKKLFNYDKWSNLLWMDLYLKNKSFEKRTYDGHSSHPESLFWVWYKAYWKIWGWWSYQCQQINDRKTLHLYEPSNFKSEMYYYLLQSFQTEINKKEFKDFFWVDLKKDFQEEINYLIKKEIIKEDENYFKYIWNEKDTWYYWLLLLDTKFLILFLKNNFLNPKNTQLHEWLDSIYYI